MARDPISGRHVTFGTPGQADISGILADGTRLEVEVKTLRGEQDKQQVRFEEMIRAMQGQYWLIRAGTPEDAAEMATLAIDSYWSDHADDSEP